MNKTLDVIIKIILYTLSILRTQIQKKNSVIILMIYWLEKYTYYKCGHKGETGTTLHRIITLDT